MTQYQFQTIIKIIENGAPALSSELTSSLNNLLLERNKLLVENDELKTKLSSLTNSKKE